MDELLAQPTRRKIFEVVSKNPGSSARDVQRLARLGWGETAYHLEQLTEAGVIRRERGGRRDYYFAPAMTWEDRRLFQALRSPAQRRMLLVLSETPGLTLGELREKLGLSLSTTSFHVRQLLSYSIIEVFRTENLRRYRAVRPQRVAELVKSYQGSFEDRLVDRFVEAWSGLFGG
jgi:predicted transcriptional regulator